MSPAGPFGQVVWADLPVRLPQGHEQEGGRPCLLIADPGVVDTSRFPVVMLAPLTSARVPASRLYPLIPAGRAGLSLESAVLLDQLLTVDVRWVGRKMGTLDDADLELVRVVLRAIFGRALGAQP